MSGGYGDGLPTGGWVFISLYLLGLLGIGFMFGYGNRGKTVTAADHYLAGRNLGTITAMLSLYASSWSGYTEVGGPGDGYKHGFTSMFWIPGNVMFAAWIGWCAPRIHFYAHTRKYEGTADFIADRFRNHFLTVSIVAIQILPVLLYVMGQLSGVGTTMSAMSGYDPDAGKGMSKFTSAAIFLMVMFFYEFTGGMAAIAMTDVCQAGILLCGFCLYYILHATVFNGLPNARDILVDCASMADEAQFLIPQLYRDTVGVPASTYQSWVDSCGPESDSCPVKDFTLEEMAGKLVFEDEYNDDEEEGAKTRKDYAEKLNENGECSCKDIDNNEDCTKAEGCTFIPDKGFADADGNNLVGKMIDAAQWRMDFLELTTGCKFGKGECKNDKDEVIPVTKKVKDEYKVAVDVLSTSSTLADLGSCAAADPNVPEDKAACDILVKMAACEGNNKCAWTKADTPENIMPFTGMYCTDFHKNNIKENDDGDYVYIEDKFRACGRADDNASYFGDIEDMRKIPDIKSDARFMDIDTLTQAYYDGEMEKVAKVDTSLYVSTVKYPDCRLIPGRVVAPETSRQRLELTFTKLANWMAWNIAGMPFVVYPHVMDRYYGARDVKVLRSALHMIHLSLWISAVPAILMGISVSVHPELDDIAVSNEVYARFLMYLVDYNAGLYLFGCLIASAAFAAYMSTADSGMMAFSSMLTLDIAKFYVPFFKKENYPMIKADDGTQKTHPNYDRNLVRLGKVCSVFGGVFALLFSTIDSLNKALGDLYVWQGAFLMCSFPAFVFGMFTTEVCSYSVLVGTYISWILTIILQKEAEADDWEPIGDLPNIFWALLTNTCCTLIAEGVIRALKMSPGFEPEKRPSFCGFGELGREFIGMDLSGAGGPKREPWKPWWATLLCIGLSVAAIPYWAVEDPPSIHYKWVGGVPWWGVLSTFITSVISTITILQTQFYYDDWMAADYSADSKDPRATATAEAAGGDTEMVASGV